MAKPKSITKYRPEQIERAQNDGMVLVAFEFYGHHAKRETMSMRGPFTVAEADALFKVVFEAWHNRAKTTA